MKKILLIFLTLSFLQLSAQETKKEFDPVKFHPPYTLSMEDWGIERFLIPIEFAPGIEYTGVEDLRFTRGWGDSTSGEYWTYAYLWFLEGKPEISAAILEKNMAMYYDGLVGRNIERRKIPADKVIATKASFKKITTASADLFTFQGEINMLDYMLQQHITLNCIAHYRQCSNQKDKTFIFYQISPKPVTDVVWIKLNKLWTEFKCEAAPVKY